MADFDLDQFNGFWVSNWNRYISLLELYNQITKSSETKGQT